MKKYVINSWSTTPVETEVERETKDFVIFKNGRKDKKITDWQGYFDTEIEAYDFVVNNKKLEFKKAKNSFDYCQEKLNSAIKMRNEFIESKKS
jgi:hypothetical protein